MTDETQSTGPSPVEDDGNRGQGLHQGEAAGGEEQIDLAPLGRAQSASADTSSDAHQASSNNVAGGVDEDDAVKIMVAWERTSRLNQHVRHAVSRQNVRMASGP